MFTKRSVWTILCAVVLTLISWNLDNRNGYIIVSVSIAVILISLIHFLYSIGRVDCQHEITNIAHEDDILEIKLHLKNLSSLTKRFFQINDNFPAASQESKVISILIGRIVPKILTTFSYSSLCYKRGLYKVGPIEVIFQDFLGLFKLVKRLNVISDLLVYPKIFKIKYFPELIRGSREWFGLETAKTSGESLEFYGIREYQRQDGLRRVHWKSTARLGNLTVKQFERSMMADATIVMNLNKSHNIGTGKHTTLEYAVKIAGSISKYLLLEQQCLVQIIGYGKDFMVSEFFKGDSGYYSILEYLAQVDADGEHDMAEVLGEASYVINHNSTLITFLHDKDEAAFDVLAQLKVKEVDPVLFIFDSHSFFNGENRTQPRKLRFPGLVSLGASIYTIANGDDLESKFALPLGAQG